MTPWQKILILNKYSRRFGQIKKLFLLNWLILSQGSLITTVVFADDTSPSYLTDQGIESTFLNQSPYNLTGRKIAIGQMEMGRPVQFLFDKLGNWQPPYNLSGTYQLDQISPRNSFFDSHAGMVAQVMVSNDKRYPGVATGARLYSTAMEPFSENLQPQQCLSAQFLSQRDGGNIRAINLSYGESLERDERKKPN